MSKLAYIAASFLLTPTPVLAQIAFQDAPATPAKAPGAKSDLDKLQCRSQDTLGSRLQSHQVCMTKQQWWQYEQDNKQKTADLQQLTPTRPSK